MCNSRRLALNFECDSTTNVAVTSFTPRSIELLKGLCVNILSMEGKAAATTELLAIMERDGEDAKGHQSKIRAPKFSLPLANSTWPGTSPCTDNLQASYSFCLSCFFFFLGGMWSLRKLYFILAVLTKRTDYGDQALLMCQRLDAVSTSHCLTSLYPQLVSRFRSRRTWRCR